MQRAWVSLKAFVVLSFYQLEDLLCGRKSDLSTLDKVPCMKKAVQTTLELLAEREGGDHAPPERGSSEQQAEPSAVTAGVILISALDGE